MSAKHHIELPNRVLAWQEFGAADGRPVMYFHGCPSSSHEASYLDDAARERGLRLIATDRPGMGESSLSPVMKVTDWPRDIRFLADHLELDRFSVVAFSHGAPYAWACGASPLGERIGTIAVASGQVPADSHLWATARAMRALFGLPLMMGRIRNPEKVERCWVEHLEKRSDAEAAAAHDDAWRRVALASLAEAFAEGPGGTTKDYSLATGANWGFALSSIRGPRCLVWHGDADRTVAVADVRAAVGRIPNAEITVLANEGHHSTWVNHHGEVLDTLA